MGPGRGRKRLREPDPSSPSRGIALDFTGLVRVLCELSAFNSMGWRMERDSNPARSWANANKRNGLSSLAQIR